LKGVLATGREPPTSWSSGLASTGLESIDLVRQVTCKEPFEWTARATRAGRSRSPKSRRRPASGASPTISGRSGTSSGLLHEAGFDVTVVPATFSAAETLALRPDAVFLSNGPGDPAVATYAIEAVRGLIGRVPAFGICLGHQIAGLALGAKTIKLKFGHRGANHP
jgi:carbamoyl-phosphate synthase small subunit